jgi:hypothetical protein
MELASMLAGGPFTDRPKSACRVIGAFLRAYNDAVDDERRQGLYRCAADVVGTRAARATERARIERCVRELADLRGRRAPVWRRALGRALRGLDSGGHLTAPFAQLARALASSDGGQERALALVDELAGIQVPPAPPSRPMSGAHAPTNRRSAGPALTA